MLYPFDHPHADDPTPIVGGKGRSLWAMTGMGLPVPPGFTLPIGGDWSMDEIKAGLERVGAALGRRFGDPLAPLLVSVRSGAAQSMPGMMDTVLNVGLTEATAAGLAQMTGNPAFAQDSYQRFLHQFATTVLGLETEATTIDALYPLIRAGIGADTDDAYALLERTISAVYASWNSDRAKHYRKTVGLLDEGGTAVTVQAMVFGNLNDQSGTGVVFSRDPRTGEPGSTGDYLANAQGEAVVAGQAATVPYVNLVAAHPEIDAALENHLKALESYYSDMVDVEFTIEDGKLWILQARVGKRTPEAAARIAVDMEAEGALPREAALSRIPDNYFSRDAVREASGADALTTGLGASPGLATGAIVLDPMDAIDRAEDGSVILVRQETSPADIHGMSVASGILTTLGGQMSHAAVVARSWSLPAVVGAADVQIGDGQIMINGRTFAEGETLTLDGGTGAVFAGERSGEAVADPVREIIEQWKKEVEEAV
ncbi:MAG: PEP/pyruvate-binding domain-containing protein [Litorimonas sp.]